MHAKTVAKSIIHFLKHSGLNLNSLIGQGYDGCSAMSGIHNGVQAIIKNEFPKDIFVHCSSHRLNLVINDLNKLQHIQNYAGIIKSIIKFFRLSPKRRKRIKKIQLFCETRWPEKYKTKRIFSEHFVGIVEQLEIISMETGVDSQTIYIALTIALTCSVERTFSTLRRVKTWIRNTIGDNRLNGLCMIAVHKKFFKNHKLELIEEIINEFGLLPRRMELLFND
jgi:hypothetical protein